MQDLGDFIDMETMQFVSPYEVNPIVEETITAEQPQQVSVNQDYLTLTTNKLKMEEFSDLPTILSVENLDLTGSVDELSTPVFDKGAFDFYVTKPVETKKSTATTNLEVKLELNAQYYPCGWLANDDSPLQNNNDTFSVSTASLDDTYAQILPYNEPIMNDPTSFASNLILSSNNIKQSNSTATSPQDDRYSYVSSPDQQNMDLVVPEHYSHGYDPKLKLNLMTEEFKFPFKEERLSTLNTPDVIEGVVNMGNEFNILDLVNNEDITILSADEELLSALTSPTTTTISSEPPTPLPAKKSRRRKHSTSEDDDEDYVPPASKKSSTIRFSDIDIEEQSSSSDDYLPSSKKSKSRGRPRKVSASEGRKNSEKSKYRELRDKNNEASRKSRQKRKEKEKEYEKEADELHVKNIKLKAQVEELEKMVSSFRNNLFKILVSK